MTKSDCEVILNRIITLSEDKKVNLISTFNVSQDMWYTDYIVVLTVGNPIHCRALIETFKTDLLPEIATLNSVDFHDEIKQSGSPESGWVILDLNSILIHCVTESARDFYKLDSIYEKYGVIHHH